MIGGMDGKIIEELNELLDEQDAEIKRLRGLLETAKEGIDEHWITTEEGQRWLAALTAKVE